MKVTAQPLQTVSLGPLLTEEQAKEIYRQGKHRFHRLGHLALFLLWQPGISHKTLARGHCELLRSFYPVPKILQGHFRLP